MNNNNNGNRSKKFLALIICLNLVVMLAVGGTLAYIFTSSDPVVNTFTPVKADIVIVETFNGEVKENVYVKNTGDVDAYVRAKVVINWLDADNNVLPAQPTEATYKIDWSFDGKDIDGNVDTSETSNWFYYEADGLHYYTLPIVVGGSTSNLIDKVIVEYPDETTYKLHVEILSQAVQAEPKTAVEELWKVTISQGSVTAVTPSQSE